MSTIARLHELMALAREVATKLMVEVSLPNEHVHMDMFAASELFLPVVVRIHVDWDTLFEVRLHNASRFENRMFAWRLAWLCRGKILAMSTQPDMASGKTPRGWWGSPTVTLDYVRSALAKREHYVILLRYSPRTPAPSRTALRRF